MALQTTKTREIAEGFIKLSQEEALAHQKSVIRDWPSKFEVFFLQNSPLVTAAASGFSAYVLLNHFRRVVRADWKIFCFTLFPGAILPSYFSMYNTEVGLTNDILLMKVNCAVCHQLKFAIQQTFCGIILPTIYGLTTVGMYAHITKTYSFPTGNSAALWKEYWKLFKTGTKKIQYLGLLQAAVILLVPMMEAKEFYNVMKKLDDNIEDTELLRP